MSISTLFFITLYETSSESNANHFNTTQEASFICPVTDKSEASEFSSLSVSSLSSFSLIISSFDISFEPSTDDSSSVAVISDVSPTVKFSPAYTKLVIPSE